MHTFKGPFSGTTRVSQYQKVKTSLDFAEARDSEWQWHQLGHMQVCTSLQTDNHVCTPPFSFFTGRMPFLPPNQQRQSTDGHTQYINVLKGTSNCIGTVYKYCNNEANKPVSRKIRETILHFSISGRLLPYLAANVDFNSDF